MPDHKAALQSSNNSSGGSGGGGGASGNISNISNNSNINRTAATEPLDSNAGIATRRAKRVMKGT